MVIYFNFNSVNMIITDWFCDFSLCFSEKQNETQWTLT